MGGFLSNVLLGWVNSLRLGVAAMASQKTSLALRFAVGEVRKTGFVGMKTGRLAESASAAPGGSIMMSVAEATGFEPAISGLTGRHVRPLHHASSCYYIITELASRQADAS